MSQDQDMDIQRLSAIATDAITTVICVHVNNKFHLLADIYKTTIKDTVAEIFHLREQARDSNVAHLQIACDAAVAVAHKYNSRNADHEINPRWVYHCVQSLLSIQLKPELMLDGKVDRLLPFPTTTARSATFSIQGQGDEDDQHADAEPTGTTGSTLSSTLSSVSTMTELYEAAVDVDTATSSEHSGDDGVGVLSFVPQSVTTKEAKTPWSEDDIRTMIELKSSGLTHEQVAAHIGRGKGSVENKYGRVVKEEAWQSVVTQFGARAGGRGKKRQTPPREDDHGEDDGQVQAGPSASKKMRTTQPKA